jgi:P-type Ca2+ transporter type 2C
MEDKLFGKKSLALSLLQGVSMLAGVIVIFVYALNIGKGEADARTLTFATLVIANLTLIVANLSWSQSLIKTLNSENKALKIVLVGAIFGLLLVLYVPVLRDLFHFSMLHGDDLFAAFSVGTISVLWLKIITMLRPNNS